MTNYQTGHDVEKRVAEYLKSLGFEIVDMNWKTRYCEIDIVAKKADCVYFVEVKSRRSSAQGEGFDYITPAKLKKMTFAADMWTSDNSWDGDRQLSAASVDDGQIKFLEQVI